MSCACTLAAIIYAYSIQACFLCFFYSPYYYYVPLLILLLMLVAWFRRVSDGKAGVTTKHNPAYGLNHFYKKHKKTGDEYDHVQSSPAAAAPQETVYERVS